MNNQTKSKQYNFTLNPLTSKLLDFMVNPLNEAPDRSKVIDQMILIHFLTYHNSLIKFLSENQTDLNIRGIYQDYIDLIEELEQSEHHAYEVKQYQQEHWNTILFAPGN